MGTQISSLYVLEINVSGYSKKLFLITHSQLYKKVGKIVVDYLSLIYPYNSSRSFIETLHSQLAEEITVDDTILIPQDDIDYKKKEIYMTKFMHNTLVKCAKTGEGVDIDNFTTINIYQIEDKTNITL